MGSQKGQNGEYTEEPHKVMREISAADCTSRKNRARRGRVHENVLWFCLTETVLKSWSSNSN